MAVPFTKFTTTKWAVLINKIYKRFIVIGIIKDLDLMLNRGDEIAPLFKMHK